MSKAMLLEQLCCYGEHWLVLGVVTQAVSGIPLNEIT
jgi:hypothetical protein